MKWLTSAASAVAVATLFGSNAPPLGAQDWKVERCNEIKTMLRRFVGGDGVPGELELARAAGKKEEENRIARLINLLNDQAAELKCEGARIRPPDLPSRNPGAADGSAGGGAVDKPPIVKPPTTGAGTGAGAPKPIAATKTDWPGDWKHEFGTMSIVPNSALDLRNDLETDNASGAKVQCDGTAVFTGHVEWTRAGGAYDGPWSGNVTACTNGNALEGKITNWGSAQRPIRSASFKITMKNDAKNEFAGAYTVKHPEARGPVAWTAKKE